MVCECRNSERLSFVQCRQGVRVFRPILFLFLMGLAATSQAQALRGFLNGQEFRLPADPVALVSAENTLIVKYSEVTGAQYIGITDLLADGFFESKGCSPLQLLEQSFTGQDEGCSADWVHAMTFFYVDDVPHGTQRIKDTRFYYAQSDGKTYLFVYLDKRVFLIDSDYLSPQDLIARVVLPES